MLQLKKQPHQAIFSGDTLLVKMDDRCREFPSLVIRPETAFGADVIKNTLADFSVVIWHRHVAGGDHFPDHLIWPKLLIV